MTFLRIHRHAGVVAHMLVGTGGDVEQGGLSAVGIAHQGDADHVIALLGQMLQGHVQALTLLHVLR